MSKNLKRRKSNVDYYNLPMGEGVSVSLDPLCPESTEWYLTEVCDYPSDAEMIKIFGKLPDKPPEDNKGVQCFISHIDSDAIKKLREYHKNTSRSFGLFIESSRDDFFKSERMLRLLKDDAMKGKEV